MFKMISDFFGSLFHGSKRQDPKQSNEINISIAELLFHVALSDNKITEDERRMIYSTAQEKLGVPITFLEQHMTEMNKGADKNIDLVHISNLLKKELSQDQRENLVRTLTSLTYSDNQLDGTEDLRVWEIAQLLDVEILRPLTD
jgi:uncharacterized tellurite resistance protein B-like protein